MVSGDVPSPVNPPSGCRFHPRCPQAQDRCKVDDPQLAGLGGSSSGHVAACHFPLAVTAAPEPMTREPSA
jgi:oligopeptide/dipeptide ABC transporter ATP-binding protein